MKLKEVKLDFTQPKESLFAQTRTFTPEQIAEQQKIDSQLIAGRTVTLSPLAPEFGEVNLNPGRIITSPLIFASETFVTKGGNILEGFAGITKQVKTEGIFATGVSIGKGTLQSAATDPFGFIGEGLAGGVIGKPIKQIISRKTAKIEGLDLETTSKTLETSATGHGFGVQQVDIKGKVDVTQGLIFKDTRTVDVEATGLLEKKTVAFGKIDPRTTVTKIKPSQISTEFTPTDILKGKLDVKVDSKVKTVGVEAFKQQDLQITTIDSKTAFSRTEPTIKLDGEQIFRTRTFDPRSKDLTVSLSKRVKTKPSVVPTQELFAQAAITQTDVFIKGKAAKPIPEQIIDVDVIDTAKPKKVTQKQLEFEEIAFGAEKEVKFIDLGKGEPISVVTEQKISPKVTGQQQIFKEVQFQEQIPTAITKLDSKPILDTKVDTKVTQTPFDVQLPTSFLKDIIPSKKGISFITPFSFGVTKPQELFEEERVQQKQPIKAVEFGKLPIETTRTKFSFDTGFRFDTEVTQDLTQKQITTPDTPTPSIPQFTPPVPTTPPEIKLNLDFGTFKKKVSKKKKDDFSIGEGIFISSLGGLLTGVTTKEPPKTLTGLEIRGIRIRK